MREFKETPYADICESDKVSNRDGLEGYVWKHPLTLELIIGWEDGSDTALTPHSSVMVVER